MTGCFKALTGARRFKPAELSGRRCSECGYVEFFVETQAKPVKTLKSIDDENERLRNLIIKLQDRVATLEVIATDPGERTSREIDASRPLPPAEGGPDE